MGSDIYLRLYPSIKVLLLGDSDHPNALVILHGEQKEVFAPLAAADRAIISALAHGKAVPRDAPIVNWLLSNGFAELQNDPPEGLPPDWPERWSRQLSAYSLFAGIDGAVDIHSRVTSSHILIVGLGGIGCHVTQQLASIGVRRFTLVDPDHVEASNLNRQILYSQKDIGKKKVDTAEQFLKNKEQNGGDITINSVDMDFLDWEPTEEWLNDAALAVISADNNPAQIHRRACDLFYPADIPYGFASYSGSRATLGPLVFRTDRGCGNCDIMRIPVEDSLDPFHGPGLRTIPPSSASRNGLLASALVNKWVRSLNEPSPPFSIIFDLGDLTTTRIKHQRLPSCPVCGEESL